MEKKPLPDNLVDLQLVVDKLYDEYQLPDNTREDRLEIRSQYAAAAVKYNKLAGRAAYYTNINLQTKTPRTKQPASDNDKIK